eukprot:g19367.t1
MVVRKLLEKILRDKIYVHLESISDRQHGFVRERSCLINLIEFFEEVTKLIDEEKVGSVLGPLLFVIYINDLEENVAGLIRKFADNAK